MKRFETKIQVDWSEVDYMRHVNNLAILRYIQTARVRWCEQMEMMPYQTEDGSGPILASVSCEYRMPLFYPDEALVQTVLEKTGNTSLTPSHRVLNGKGELAAEARDVLVCFDYASGKKKVISRELRGRFLTEGEGASRDEK